MESKRLIFFLEPLKFPAGGQAAIYRHVETLSNHGIPAYIALRKRPKIDFYSSKVPLIIYGSWPMRLNYGNGALRNWQLRRTVRPGDVWVVPETCSSILSVLKGTPAKRIMFCQNHHFLSFGRDPNLGVEEFGADKIVVSAESIHEFFKYVYNVNVMYLQSYSIDKKIFPSAQKKRRIAFMPRKLPNDARFIQNIFRRRYPKYAEIPWVSVDGVTQNEVGRILSESAVFLSLSFKDSLGLPPLEAMSCGCLVAGFHGEGGRTFATNANGWWANSDDWVACVEGLASALELYDTGGLELDKRYEAMEETVSKFNPERVDIDVLDFWRRQLD